MHEWYNTCRGWNDQSIAIIKIFLEKNTFKNIKLFKYLSI